ncbi:hypothetical protein R3I93_002304 [Phoxinus phoxinus]|uniref:TNF family profile domain-containing protein n=1 Tax=Phoxinus phoxinus TaxID=58324 RepID=A0AAN9HGV1_9TELE
MSLSAEYCSEKTGDRGGGGGALAHQRRLIRGLLVWATLLTLGLAASITLHFIHRESPAPDKPQDPGKHAQPTPTPKVTELMSFSPNWSGKDPVELLEWKTEKNDFIEINSTDKQLKVKYDGQYFLYVQLTLEPHMKGNYTITMQSNIFGVILKGLTNGSTHSTFFMGKGFKLSRGDLLNVTCKPKAKIQINHTLTHLGVIRLR